MAKIDVTKTELVWPGKYNEDGSLREVPRVNLPFQVIERVNESRATREAQKNANLTLFDFYSGKEGVTFEDGWRNKLIWGDNILVMSSLLEKFAGKVDLIYIDPPFATGADFSFKTSIGDGEDEIHKEQSIIEEKAYRDTWGKGPGSFMQMIYDRISLIKMLMSPTASLYVHCDWRMSGVIRLILDEIMSGNHVNEIIWCYSIGGKGTDRFGRKHDTIFLYSKGEDRVFNAKDPHVLMPRKPNSHMRAKVDADGREYQEKTDKKSGKVYRYYVDQGAIPTDYWTDIEQLNWEAAERVGYDTQKPERLLSRVIAASTNEGGLVCDFFCGSGTTLAVAEKLGRRWIGCDLGRWAIHTTRKRLLEIEGCKPFEVLNLGKYERQYWQGSTLGSGQSNGQLLYEYLAFVLKLYQSQPLSGMSHIHGKKGAAMVHIGAIDSPVTIDEVSLAIEECVKTKQPELHVLGWEWEMGLAGPNNGVKKGSPMHDVAKQKGIKLLLLQIPREVMEKQAVDKGHLTFFELAYLNVEINQAKNLHVSITLKDFVIPNTELIPEEVREKVKKWSDYIDYWAVDWDFQNDSFMQGWVTYRTRKDRSLALASDVHKYEKPGTYRVLVKVVDIFGNDTSQAYTIEVK